MPQTTDSLLAELNSLAEEFRNLAQSRFKEYLSDFWAKNPAIKAIIWKQYAPYFNDGEPCVFGVHDPYFTNAEGEDLNDISAWGEYEGEKEGIWSDYSFGGAWQEPTPEGVDEQSVENFGKLICSNVMVSTMEAMFGPDNRVVATREGFSVEDFSEQHD